MQKPEWKFPVCLAPMVGLSHVAMRLLVQSYMPKNEVTFWPTEMLSSRKLPKENLATTPETLRDESESFLVPQILGNEEKEIAESVKRLEDWGAYAIDINMGCPVQKALKHNYGVALMGDAKYAKEVVAMTVRNTKLPVSVKLRAGVQNDFSYLLDFVNGLVEEGASWITLHPRTGEMKRRGNADWSQIQKLKNLIQVPVIGNGDIQVCDDVFDMLESTRCDRVMVGRALTVRPWLMWQVGERLGLEAPEGRGAELAPKTPEEEGAEYGKSLLKLIEIMRKFFNEDLALRKLRFYVRTSHVWLEFGHSVVVAVSKAKNLAECEENIKKLFQSEMRMFPRTELRQ